MIKYRRKLQESSPMEISRSQIIGDAIIRREKLNIPGLELLEVQRDVDDKNSLLFYVLDNKNSNLKPTVLWSSRLSLADIEQGLDEEIFGRIAQMANENLIKLGGLSLNDQLDTELHRFKRVR